MDTTATDGLVIRNMIIVGLGIGVLMSLFTIVVQNAFPMRQLGEVTASITFFRSIGSTIGVAVLGSAMTNQFQSALGSNMPAALSRAVPPDKLAALKNPQVLLAPGAAAKIQHAFAAFGAQGAVLFGQLMHAIRVSLASAISEVFLVGAGAMALALLATFFLREIPLRKANGPREAVGEAPEPATGPQRTEALMGLTLAVVARQAQQQDASPHLLGALSSMADGQFPHTWSAEERGRAVAREVIQPLAAALLAASIVRKGGDYDGHVTRTPNGRIPVEVEAATVLGLEQAS